MAPDDLARRMRAKRRRWLEIDEPPRRALLVERPSELALMRMRGGATFDQGVELATNSVVDWRGVVESDLLGAAIGSSDDVPFAREVFVEWAAEDAALLDRVATFLTTMQEEHAQTKGTAGKN